MARLLKLDHLITAMSSVGVTLTREEDAAADAPLYVWVDDQEHVLYIGKSGSKKRVNDERHWKSLRPNLGSGPGSLDPRVHSGFVSLVRSEDGTRVLPLRVAKPGHAEWWRTVVDSATAVATAWIDRGGTVSDRMRQNTLANTWIESWTEQDIAALKGEVETLEHTPTEHQRSDSTSVELVANWLLWDLRQWRWHLTTPTDEEIENVMIRVAVRSGSLIGNSHFAGQWESLIWHRCDTLALLAVERSSDFPFPAVPGSDSTHPDDEDLAGSETVRG